MRKVEHSPAYVLQVKSLWRVVVPVRGKLTPLLCSEEFSSRTCAEEWLKSEEGLCAISAKRVGRAGRRAPSAACQSQNIAAAGQS